MLWFAAPSRSVWTFRLICGVMGDASDVLVVGKEEWGSVYEGFPGGRWWEVTSDNVEVTCVNLKEECV